MRKTRVLVRIVSALGISALISGCSGVGSPGANLTPSGLARSSANALQFASEHVLYTFQGGSDGGNPYAGLIAGKNGEFYGTTFDGGVKANYGTAFMLSADGTKTILYAFQGGTDGTNPQAGLTAGKNGVLYGDTVYGGGTTVCTAGCGTAFVLTPSGSGYAERVAYAFQGGTDGASPVGGVFVDKSGAIYGTTAHGGSGSACTGGCGTAFKLTPSRSGYTETILYSFNGGSDGIGPRGSLIGDTSGVLYGTTIYGGKGTCSDPSGFTGCGTAFKLTRSGSGYTEKVIHSFQGGTGDGQYPRSALLAGSKGALYGATTRGGASNAGTVYELTRSGTGYAERVLHAFAGADGLSPTDENGLHVDGSGALYGTTANGGAAVCGCGTVFKLTPSGSVYSETVLHSFKGGSDGAGPRGGPVADSAGALYGTTFSGAKKVRGCSGGCGTAFKVSP